MARHPERPYTQYYISAICTKFIELHGDRYVKDDKAIIGGIAEIDGQSVVIIGHQKGTTTKLRQYRNFGMANPDGYRKALRIMKLAEKFGFPVISLIDTPGAYPGIEAEERGQAEAIARNLFEMAQLKVPIVCYIIGEGASGGALGIGVGDRVFMLENTWYSVISPESCSSILWRSWDFKEKAADALKLTSKGRFEKGKLVVLIDEGSASAAEIYSGCMQDLDRAIIVGRRSFGKGLVQKPFGFADGSLVRLTVAHYYTSSGRCIQRPYNEGKKDYYDEYSKRLKSGELFGADTKWNNLHIVCRCLC